MPKTIDIIKEIMQSDEPIIAMPSNEPGKEKLYLYRSQEELCIQGQPAPKETYLLVSKNSIDELKKHGVNIERAIDESINAFVLPYNPDNVGTVKLDSSADLVVTPRLTGCTVAAEIGATKPTLHHLNYRYTEKTDPVLNGKINQKKIDNYLEKHPTTKDGALVVRKADYFPEKESCYFASTFMGFRQADNTWDFYNQTSECNENTDTFKVTPASKLPTPKLEQRDKKKSSFRGLFDFRRNEPKPEPAPASKINTENDSGYKPRK